MTLPDSLPTGPAPVITKPPSLPYRGIKPFRYVDSPIFFGRQEEAHQLLRTIAVYRGILLFGDSGVGKSSLINAGLIPLALKEGFQPERLRIQPRWGEEIIVERISEKDHGNAPYLASYFAKNDNDASLILSSKVFLEKLKALRTSEEKLKALRTSEEKLKALRTPKTWRRPLLIFDQFEEFFTLFEVAPKKETLEEAQAAQVALLEAIVTLLHDHTIPAKLLFVFREDYLAKLNVLFERYPELLDRYFRLVSLRTEKLDTIIRGPFEAFPGHFKKELPPDLATRLAAQIKKRSRGLLNLSEIQIACRRLWQANAPEHLFEEKGVDGLLGDFLSDALDALDGVIRYPATALLIQLVTESGTRNVLSKEDLLKRVEDEEGISKYLALDALKALEKSGLVRCEPRHEVFVYEIVSEFLAPDIYEKKVAREEIRKARAQKRRVAWSGFFLFLIFAATWIVLLTMENTNAKIKGLNNEINDLRGTSFEKEREIQALKYLITVGSTTIEQLFTNEIGMQFTVIPAGSFDMGSNIGNSGTDKTSDEKPVHQVKINKWFYMSTYEVTQREWREIMKTTPWKGQPYVEEGDSLPAVYVSWNDTQEFIQRLNARERDTLYRMPTEAEWEYAARAGMATEYSFGDDASKLGDYAWFDMNALKKDNEKYAHGVGQKEPNAWGLYDMHGNVWEWVADWYGADYYRKSREIDPPGPDSSMFLLRVIRGGSWKENARHARSASRHRSRPSQAFADYGFRLVREIREGQAEQRN